MINTYNFHFDFYENRILPPYYKVKKRDLNHIDPSKNENDRSQIGAIMLIPPYLNYTRNDLEAGFACSEKKYWMGFAIDLQSFSNSQEYLREQLGKKPYKNLRQDIQRLERDYQISFKTYYGSVDKSTYQRLMIALKEFILERFKGRTHKHTALNKWEHYEQSVHQMILKKNASLFVILDKEVPIGISLNYHYKGVLIAAISSFNYNFCSYSLGKQLFVRQIDWCYENNYRLIDMGWGSFDYKIKFSNAVFKYTTQIVYPEKSILKQLISRSAGWFLYIKYYLVMLKYRKLKSPEKTYKGRWLKYNIIENMEYPPSQ